MQNFMKTIISAVKAWTEDKFLDKERFVNSIADWNENDSGKDSYVKNRTHWEEEKIVKTISLSGTYNGSWNYIAYDTTDLSSLWVEGNEIIVKWNGIQYNLTVRWDSAMGYNGIGNFSQYLPSAENTGEPFAIYVNGFGSDRGIIIAAGSEETAVEATCEISFSGTVIHKLDSKYLDLDIDTKMDMDNPVGTGSFSMNRKVDTIIGDYSHAEGYDTTASSTGSHAEGQYTTASGANSHAEGNGTTASDFCSHAEGNSTTASGSYSHAEGDGTTASGLNSHAEGCKTKATSSSSDTALTTPFKTAGYYTHAEGYGTVAYGTASHAEGNGTTASGLNSHAEGCKTKATSSSSDTALTTSSIAAGYYTHAEGYGTVAYGTASHAEGNGTTASGSYSHAEGYHTTASNFYSHAEGYNTTASGHYSHAEGYNTTASSASSHAEGYYTTASSANSHVEGKFNIEDSSKKYAHIVGNGTHDTERSNAHTLDWNGVGWFQGGLQVGGTAQDNGAQTVMLNGDKEIILASSTEGSTKKFKLTIDDNGVLTASEIETTT